MEEALRSYFWDAGYFVARGLPFRLEGEDVTDVDLWLYERPTAATRRRIIVDVKNKRSPKATERVIWTAGLREALSVDAAMVATTDRRPATRRIARSLNVAVLDGAAISNLIQNPAQEVEKFLTGEEWDAAIRKVDAARGTTQWRDRIRSVRSSMLTDFGVRSANTAMGAVIKFADAAIEAQPLSEEAQTAIRAVYASAASAAVSLDFTSSDYAFSPVDDRRSAIANGIRYGQADEVDALRNVRLAVGLARDFAHNGKAIARQIEGGFRSAADSIPAEIVADYVARQPSPDFLFSAARCLEEASTSRNFNGFDSLHVSAKSMLGVLLDFAGLSREEFAKAGQTNSSPTLKSDQIDTSSNDPSQHVHDVHEDLSSEARHPGSLFPDESELRR